MRVSVVLPCLNEVGSVGDVVREARAAIADAGATGEVIVADNGSTDGSREEAATAGARVVGVSKRGYGAALLGGFNEAQGDVILMADADGSYDLSALGPMLARIGSGDELVMGSRLKGHIEPGAMPASHRYLGTPLLTWLLNLLYGIGVSDTQCGIRAVRRDALERLHLRMPGMELASEMIVNASRARLRIGEVPVTYRARKGESKLDTMRDGWRHLRFLLMYSPTALFLFPGLALLLVGMFLVGALVSGPVVIGPYFFDIHWMVLGALLALVGFQIVALGLAVKALAVALEIQPIDPTLEAFRRVFTLERGLVTGAVLFVAGLGVDLSIVVRWFGSGLGALNEVRPALLALTIMLLGMQLAFASFFVSAIDLHAGEPG